jgi:membrane associated rhomboid family serine protease
MYGNTSIWDDLKHQYRYGGSHIQLIFINVFVFILANIILLFGDYMMNSNYGSKFLLQFEMVADVKAMLLKPWAYLTYMFLHTSVFHILFNMLFLKAFGDVLKEFIGDSKTVPIFIYGGLAGAILMTVCYNTFPVFANELLRPTLGASAGVMAITVAAATLVPDYTFFLFLLGPVRIKWIALFYVVLDVILIRIDGNPGGHIAHLGGAILGFLFIIQLRNGIDLGRPVYYLKDKWDSINSPRKKIKIVHRQEQKVSSGPVETQKSNTQHRSNRSTQTVLSKQDQLDMILDKINRSGYESLTKDEREFLFKMSQE